MKKKSMKKNSKALKEIRMEERSTLINEALEDGLFIKSDLCKACGLSIYQLNEVLRNNAELKAKYMYRKKSIVDIASDNIAKIIDDSDHPKNFEASKWMVANYQSDLDRELKAKNQEDVSIELDDSSSKKTVITFSSKKKDE